MTDRKKLNALRDKLCDILSRADANYKVRKHCRKRIRNINLKLARG